MEWILRNARLNDESPLVDIAIDKGRFAAIEPAGTHLKTAVSQHSRDLNGRVLLPGLVDAHTHLDKTFSTIENKSGTLLEAIEVWQQIKSQRTASDIEQAAEKGIRLAIENGVTAMRSHIDVGDEESLTAVDVLLDLRTKYQQRMTLQFVALGEAGGDPTWRKGMEAALAKGVDFIGGAPALCANPKREIDAVFELAEQTGKGIDLHIDETEDPSILSLEYLAEQTIKLGMQGRVTAGHCCSLAFVDRKTAVRVSEKVTAAQINVVTLPSCNLVLMGRHINPMPRGATPVKMLIRAGVNVCAASDNVHDPFNPFGSYNLLQISNLNAHVAQMTGKDQLYESLNMVTTRAAQCLGLSERYGIAVGNGADCIIVDCQQQIDTILETPSLLATFKAGRLVTELTVNRVDYPLSKTKT